MIRRVFDVVQEPRGEVWRQLIHALAQSSSSVMLILRDDLGLSEAGRALLSRLEPHLLERKRSSSWPGTTLVNEEATVLRFALSKAVLSELIRASDGLYGWQQPALPEDLALMRADGTAILASICHERDAYLEITDEEKQNLIGSVIDFARIVRLHTEKNK